MNNVSMYDLGAAGGVVYPETDRYRYSKWYTTTGMTDGAAYKTIRFDIRQDNLLLHWRNAYLELKGRLFKKDGNNEAFGNDDNIVMIHNTIPHLFSTVKLTVGSKTMESINAPGHVSSMIYNVLYGRSKCKTDGLQFMWFPDSADSADPNANKGFKIRREFLITAPEANGTFKLRLPLHMLFGFMENFVILKGYPVEIELVRGPDWPALYKDANAAQGKFTFTDVLLNIPIVDPSSSLKVELLNAMDTNTPYLYSFRERHGMYAPVSPGVRDFQQAITSTFFTERPQMIWMAFQTIGTEDQTANFGIYTHANVESAYIQMNNSQFPARTTKALWTQNDNGFFYEMQKHCRDNYLQQDSTFSEGNMLTPANFKSLYPIYCFDVSKQELTLGSNTITCDLHVTFRVAVPANMRVYIVWFNDRTVQLSPAGNPIIIRREMDNYVGSAVA